jgi:hypothetical protein
MTLLRVFVEACVLFAVFGAVAFVPFGPGLILATTEKAEEPEARG